MLARIRTRLDSALAGVETTTQRLARAAITVVPWPVLLGISVAIPIWAVRHPSRLAQFDTNKLTQPERLWMLAGSVAGVLGIALVYLVAMLVRRARTGSWDFFATAGRLNRTLAPLMALPVVVALRAPGVEKDSPKLTLFLAALAAAIVGVGIYAGARPRPLSAEESALPGAASGLQVADPRPRALTLATRAGRWLGPLGVAALWAGYGVFFGRLAITNHRALNTRTTDLGYYDNIFYQSIHGRPLGCTFIKAGYHGSAHFDPILVLLSPLYLIYPRAELILVLQSVWLGAGVVPVYLLAHEKLAHRCKALLFAFLWAIYPAMHGANMYEFHSLTLIAPLVVWLLYFYEAGKHRLYGLALFALLLCREDVALLMCFVGLYGILDKRPGKPRLGCLTIAASIFYFAIVKAFFMTSAGIFMSGKDAYSFAYYYENLMPNRSGLGGLLISLLTNPVFALRTMLEEPKIVFFLQLFLPLVFLPFLAKPGRWMLAYGLLFCLLASRAAVFSISFQYSAVLFPMAFALAPGALKRVEDSGVLAFMGLDGRRLSRALLASLLVASVLVSWKFGGIVENAAFKGGFSRVTRRLSPQQIETYAWVQEQVAKIPPGASVGATNKLGAHISNRKEAYFYQERHATVHYAFIDEGELKGKDLERHNAALKRKELVELGRLGKMALFKRERASAPEAAPRPAPAGSAAPPTDELPTELGIPAGDTDGAERPTPSDTAEQDEDPPGSP